MSFAVQAHARTHTTLAHNFFCAPAHLVSYSLHKHSKHETKLDVYAVNSINTAFLHYSARPTYTFPAGFLAKMFAWPFRNERSAMRQMQSTFAICIRSALTCSSYYVVNFSASNNSCVYFIFIIVFIIPMSASVSVCVREGGGVLGDGKEEGIVCELMACDVHSTARIIVSRTIAADYRVDTHVGRLVRGPI